MEPSKSAAPLAHSNLELPVAFAATSWASPPVDFDFPCLFCLFLAPPSNQVKGENSWTKHSSILQSPIFFFPLPPPLSIPPISLASYLPSPATTSHLPRIAHQADQSIPNPTKFQQQHSPHFISFFLLFLLPYLFPISVVSAFFFLSSTPHSVYRHHVFHR